MTKVTIVGVGALGSHLVQLLRNEPVAIKVVDFDSVESKNVLSQFHARQGIAKSKVTALAQLAQFLWGLKLETVPHRLTADSADALLGGSDLIVDCLDNARSRRLVQAYSEQAGVPCLHGALAADGAYGRSCWNERFVVDEGGAGQATCEDGRHLPFIALVAACLARSVQEFVAAGRKVGFEVSPFGVVAT